LPGYWSCIRARHGVRHGVEPNRQVQISALCLPLDTNTPTPGQPAAVLIGARVATNATPITPSISDTPPDPSNLERPTSLQTVRRRAPANRGSGQPSTPVSSPKTREMFGLRLIPSPAGTVSRVKQVGGFQRDDRIAPLFQTSDQFISLRQISPVRAVSINFPSILAQGRC
jgi:hypothetical protein